jgi:hypothetical protein
MTPQVELHSDGYYYVGAYFGPQFICGRGKSEHEAREDFAVALKEFKGGTASGWPSIVAGGLLAFLLMTPASADAGQEPPAAVRAHVGYSATMTSRADALPTAAVEIEAPVSLGSESIARVLAQLRVHGIAGQTVDPGDVRTFASAEFEVALRRRVGADRDGGATYVGVRGGFAALRDADGAEPHVRNPLWYAIETTLERRDGDSFPSRWVSVGFGHSDISSPPLHTPGTLRQAARDAIPRDLIASGSVAISGPAKLKLIISGDVHRGLWGPRATTQVRLSTTVAWG